MVWNPVRPAQSRVSEKKRSWAARLRANSIGHRGRRSNGRCSDRASRGRGDPLAVAPKKASVWNLLWPVSPSVRPPICSQPGRAQTISARLARPSQILPVVRRHPETGRPTEGCLRWGLIPHSAKARPDIQPIHARAESLSDKPMFRDAYRSRQCIVPMNAFYQRDDRRKAHAFGMKDGALFGVAGIWENWRNPSTNEWERTLATITVEANALVAPAHDQMPAILRREDYARWLGPEEDPRELLRPYPAEQMVECSVARRS
jgi:putative SOS response-associated peptidase YedK